MYQFHNMHDVNYWYVCQELCLEYADGIEVDHWYVGAPKRGSGPWSSVICQYKMISFALNNWDLR